PGLRSRQCPWRTGIVGDPHVDALEKLERWRHDADRGDGDVADANRLIDRLAIGTEAAPASIAENDRLRSLVTEVILLRGEAAADGRAHAEDVEEAGGDFHVPHSFGKLAARIDDFTEHVAGDAVEGRIQPNPVLQADRGDPGLADSFVKLLELDEAIGIRVRQRAQEHRIDGGEDGAVGADAQRPRQYDGGL